MADRQGQSVGCIIRTRNGLQFQQPFRHIHHLAFLRLAGAFATDDADEATLTPKGRYLATVMYRQFLSGMSNLRDQARNALPAQERALLFGDGEK